MSVVVSRPNALVETTHNGNGNGHASGRAAHNSPPPSGRAALRKIVSERPGIWTLAELRDAMIERGWFTSEKGVEAAASRLCRLNGEGRRVGKGRYVFPANYGELPTTDETESAIESDTSGAATIAQ